MTGKKKEYGVPLEQEELKIISKSSKIRQLASC
jgi:hypothetical protein